MMFIPNQDRQFYNEYGEKEWRDDFHYVILREEWKARRAKAP